MASEVAPPIAFEAFLRVDIRAGTILNAEPHAEARNPAYRLSIDFGPDIGIKKSSAQVAALYQADELKGRQVACVVNFPPRQIANAIDLDGPAAGESLLLRLDLVTLDDAEVDPFRGAAAGRLDVNADDAISLGLDIEELQSGASRRDARGPRVLRASRAKAGARQRVDEQTSNSDPNASRRRRAREDSASAALKDILRTYVSVRPGGDVVGASRGPGARGESDAAAFDNEVRLGLNLGELLASIISADLVAAILPITDIDEYGGVRFSVFGIGNFSLERTRGADDLIISESTTEVSLVVSQGGGERSFDSGQGGRSAGGKALPRTTVKDLIARILSETLSSPWFYWGLFTVLLAALTRVLFVAGRFGSRG